MGKKSQVQKLPALSDADMIDHLWARCRNMESGDYWFFKQLHKVVNWYKKPLSEKQKAVLVDFLKKYGMTEETPKPAKKSQINPHLKQKKVATEEKQEQSASHKQRTAKKVEKREKTDAQKKSIEEMVAKLTGRQITA